MSYTKTTWSDGDVITVEKLNNIESGVENANSSGSILVAHRASDTLDKTWQEIYDAISAMIPIYCFQEIEDDYGFTYIVDQITSVSYSSENNKYYVEGYQSNYIASSPSDYPQMEKA